MKKIIALAALAAISATASASTNLFTDGSFEDIVQAPGTWGIASQATLTADEGASGWKVSAAPGLSGSVAGLEVRNDDVGVAEDANAQDHGNFIELDGNENDMISQTLATQAGKSYQITFWVADRPDQSSSFLATSGGYKFTVAGTVYIPNVGNVVVSSGSQSATGTFGTTWVEETFDFTAVSSSSVFSIWATGKSDSLGTSFDNFQAVAVPEPAPLGLFAAGLAVLGLAARRRRQQ